LLWWLCDSPSLSAQAQVEKLVLLTADAALAA
jgi:hypothetical protein